MAAIDVFNEFYAAWQQQDLEAIEGLLADDFEYQCPKTNHPELKKIMRPVLGFEGFQEWNQACNWILTKKNKNMKIISIIVAFGLLEGEYSGA